MKQIIMLPVDSIHPHPNNPRKNLGDITELAESISKNGIMQNLTVVPKEGSSYTVIIGHRRLAAAKEAGLSHVPCVITEMSPNDQVATMLLENVQRAELTPFEQMEGFQMLLDLGETVETISQKTGFSASTVRRRIKLTELDKKKLAEAMTRQVTLADLTKLEEITNIKERNKCLEKVGTSGFEASLRNALVEQKAKANKKAMLAELKKVAIELKSTREYLYEGYFSFSEYVAGQFEKYIGEEYGYTLLCGGVYLYRKDKKQPAKRETAREKDIRRHEAELKEATLKAYALRRAFIESYNPPARDELRLYKICAEGLVWSVEFGRGVYAGDFFGLYGKKAPSDYIERKLAYESILLKNKLKATVCYIYCALDYDKTSGFYTTFYNIYPSYRQSERLQKLYDFLTTLGYQMTDMEIQLSTGTHPAFENGESKNS